MKIRVSKLISIAFIFFLGISNSYCQLTTLVQKNEKAVFSIYTYDEDGKPIATATGFFIDSKGTGVTNYHVLKGATTAEIKLWNGKKYEIDKIIAEDSTCDLMKFSIVRPSNLIFHFLILSSTLPLKGQKIFVIGNPEGLESTLSEGIVSSIRETEDYGNVIQITAPISHGSSGSPIMTMNGSVVGVASFGFIEGQNLNFGIEAKKIVSLHNQNGLDALVDTNSFIDLKGIKVPDKNIKMITEQTYTTSERFGEPVKNKFSSKYIREYNRNEKEIEFDSYNENGSLIIKIISIYDNKGNQIESQEYNPDGSLFAKYVYNYNERGNKIEQYQYDLGLILNKYTFTYKYNENGKDTEQVSYKDNKFSDRYTCKIDNEGNEIECIYYNKDSTVLCKHLYKYDSKGNKIQWNRYDAENTLKARYYYKYDIFTNEIEEHGFDSDYDYSGSKWNYYYSYDSHGNWIKCISYKNDKPYQITERKVEYY